MADCTYSYRKDRKIKNLRYGLLAGLLWLPVVLTVLILLFLLGASFMGQLEMKAITENGLSAFHILPEEFTLQGWKHILLDTPEQLIYFWNGVWVALPILAGNLCVSALAGYGLGCFQFRGKKVLLLVLVILMLLPYQVTLTPNFLVLDWMGLIGSRLAVILPGIFHPLGIVAMSYFMAAVPTDSLEAARLEGAGGFRIFCRIALPQTAGGIVILALYSLMDAWNTVEPVLVLVQDTTKYPLSVALRTITENQMEVSGATSVIYVLPILLVFGMACEKLVEGLVGIRKKGHQHA